MNTRERYIIAHLKDTGARSSKAIFDDLQLPISYATLKRTLVSMTSDNLIVKLGNGKATTYDIAPSYKLLSFIDIEDYFEKEIDERVIQQRFNESLISTTLSNLPLFTSKELDKLISLHRKYLNNIKDLTRNEYLNELERLAIDLSWKSSQIEGNTYSLLETERLLKEKETASGKTKDEAIMLLNHKEAIDFMIMNKDYLNPLQVSRVEDIHSILIKDLGVERNIRTKRVGISGTNYRPLDNQFQIKEALTNTCNLINSKTNIFEKALLSLVLISYIQPFMDGNKRTARIISNAVLINQNHCPLSFRTVDSIDYKKAMLLFYEQNNMSAFKNIFIEQYEFAVNTYF